MLYICYKQTELLLLDALAVNIEDNVAALDDHVTVLNSLEKFIGKFGVLNSIIRLNVGEFDGRSIVGLSLHLNTILN